MSKCIKGEYGTFEATIIRKAVKEHCKKKKITQKQFFKDHLHMHSATWWYATCKRGYGERLELMRVARAVNFDFDKIQFKKGETNDAYEKEKAAARARGQKKNVIEQCQQMSLVFEKTEANLKEMTDSQIIEELGAERVRSLYYLAMYELSKQNQQKK